MLQARNKHGFRDSHIGLQRVDVLLVLLDLELVVVDETLHLPVSLLRRKRGRPLQLLVPVLLLLQVHLQAAELIMEIVALVGETFDSGKQTTPIMT